MLWLLGVICLCLHVGVVASVGRVRPCGNIPSTRAFQLQNLWLRVSTSQPCSSNFQWQVLDCPEATWNALSAALGNVPDLILLALLPASALKKTMTALRIGGGASELPLSAMETIQVALMCQATNLPDMEPIQDPVKVGTQPAVPPWRRR